jgi:hypothetical protein
VEQNFAPLGTNPAASSEITINTILLCFTKKFTMAHIQNWDWACLWKALVKYHSISPKKKIKKIKPSIACPKGKKPKFGFKDF